MTDNQFPILADGLFDGGLAADVAPKDLRAAVNVLSAAGRPGSEAELAAMAARVRQFSDEINAAAKAPARPATNQHFSPTFNSTAAFSSSAAFVDARRPNVTHLSADTLRSNPLFSTRITRKALTIVAITMLAAGTAAAAASGALPMFVEDEAEEVVHDNVNSDLIDDFDQFGEPQSANEQADDDSRPVSQPAPDVAVDFFGKCTAWSNGSAKDAAVPAFVDLQAAADAASLTIDEYCLTVLNTPGSDETAGDDTTGDDNATSDDGDDEIAVSTPADDETDDDEAKDNADKEKADKEKAEKEKAEKEKADKEKAEKDKADKEKAEKDKAEKDKKDKDKKDKADDDSDDDDSDDDDSDDDDSDNSGNGNRGNGNGNRGNGGGRGNGHGHGDD